MNHQEFLPYFRSQILKLRYILALYGAVIGYLGFVSRFDHWMYVMNPLYPIKILLSIGRDAIGIESAFVFSLISAIAFFLIGFLMEKAFSPSKYKWIYIFLLILIFLSLAFLIWLLTGAFAV